MNQADLEVEVPDISTIAIVDDDEAIREALENLVELCGYESRLYASAESYLADTRRSSIDCLVLDVMMPGLNGLDLQDRLNLERASPPIIFMTSYSDERTRTRAMAGGAVAFLTKPADIANLIHHIEMALQD
ncbi:response regulator [Agrobacterium tumefaciens]|uniref:response regulator transcription factor n=1 Tax=Agrobacterium tumefaciens TaxID=358 RepID=UPI00287E8BE6|nr:response regulator [Agrobacterium tumefaciens]MDS7595404.1 response regulator [Agrobacterium tumefaciens]